jgi:hypothetical protein
MLKINTNITQDSLIEGLMTEITRAGELYIEVESLPIFLSSIPAVKVFSNKINNYPKSIFWYSKNINLFRFLQISDLATGFPPTLVDNLINSDNFEGLIHNDSEIPDSLTPSQSYSNYAEKHESIEPTIIEFSKKFDPDMSFEQNMKNFEIPESQESEQLPKISEIHQKLQEIKLKIHNEKTFSQTKNEQIIEQSVDSFNQTSSQIESTSSDDFRFSEQSGSNFSEVQSRFQSYDDVNYQEPLDSQSDQLKTKNEHNPHFDDAIKTKIHPDSNVNNVDDWNSKVEYSYAPKPDTVSQTNTINDNQKSTIKPIRFMFGDALQDAVHENKPKENVHSYSESIEGTNNSGYNNFSTHSFVGSDFDTESLKQSTFKQSSDQSWESANSQNFDEWVNKVDKIKSAIHSQNFKHEAEFEFDGKSDPSLYKEDSEKGFWDKLSTTSRLFNLSFVSMIVVVGFMIWFLYPKVVWQINTGSVSREVAVDLSLDATQMKKYSQKFESSVDVLTSKKGSLDTVRAVGVVELINESSNEIILEKDSFWLQSTESTKKYYPIWEDKSTKILRIPTKLQKSDKKIEFKVQAENFGTEFDVNENTELKVLKNNSQQVAVNFRAIVKSKIQAADAKNSSPDTFSKLDEDLANQQNLQKIRIEQFNYIDTLKSKGEYSNINWLINLDQKIQSGEIAPQNPNQKLPNQDNSTSQKVTTTVNTEFYAFDQTKIISELESQNNLSEIRDINLVETKIANNMINSKVYVTYLDNPNNSINRLKIDPNLVSNNLEEAKSNLQQNYPTIKNVSVKKSGIQVPGIKPIAQVNFNSN